MCYNLCSGWIRLVRPRSNVCARVCSWRRRIPFYRQSSWNVSSWVYWIERPAAHGVLTNVLVEVKKTGYVGNDARPERVGSIRRNAQLFFSVAVRQWDLVLPSSPLAVEGNTLVHTPAKPMHGDFSCGAFCMGAYSSVNKLEKEEQKFDERCKI